MMELEAIERSGEREVFELRFFDSLVGPSLFAGAIFLASLAIANGIPAEGARRLIPVAIGTVLAVGWIAMFVQRNRRAPVLRITVTVERIEIDHEEGVRHWGEHRYRPSTPLDPEDTITIKPRSIVSPTYHLDGGGSDRARIYDVRTTSSDSPIALRIESKDDALTLALTLHDALARLRQRGRRISGSPPN